MLIVGSGNVVHNLRAIDWDQPHTGFAWAQRFDEDVRSLMLSAPAELGRLADHDDFRLAVPTPDHFLPLAYVAGVASASGQPAEILVDGYTMGSLSMSCSAIGATVTVDPHETEDAPPLPHVPADETNV